MFLENRQERRGMKSALGILATVKQEGLFEEPMSGYGVTVEWSTNRIQSAARDAGISPIRYMDIQTISFLLGSYSQRKLIIYGD